MVGMTKVVANIRNLAPFDVWYSNLEIIRSMPGSFAQNFEKSLECRFYWPVRLNVREGLVMKQLLNLFDCIRNIGKSVFDAILHLGCVVI